nr:uncharacterized protein LOC106028521 [Cavia porcellus]
MSRAARGHTYKAWTHPHRATHDTTSPRRDAGRKAQAVRRPQAVTPGMGRRPGSAHLRRKLPRSCRGPDSGTRAGGAQGQATAPPRPRAARSRPRPQPHPCSRRHGRPTRDGALPTSLWARLPDGGAGGAAQSRVRAPTRPERSPGWTGPQDLENKAYRKIISPENQSSDLSGPISLSWAAENSEGEAAGQRHHHGWGRRVMPRYTSCTTQLDLREAACKDSSPPQGYTDEMVHSSPLRPPPHASKKALHHHGLVCGEPCSHHALGMLRSLGGQ